MTIHTSLDEEIQADVLEELKWDTRVRPNEIGVTVKDGIVTLTGWVDSYVQKLAARDAAHRVHQVKAVANDIEVRLPGLAERTDADLAAAVLNALKWDIAVASTRVDVTVSNGWVTLQGEVEYGFQKKETERVVYRLSGIKGVSNQILVKPHLLPADLKQNIERALVRNAETDAKQITVEVQGSKVTLYGRVRSYVEKQEAEDSVWSAPGVTDVDNHLMIKIIP